MPFFLPNNTEFPKIDLDNWEAPEDCPCCREFLEPDFLFCPHCGYDIEEKYFSNMSDYKHCGQRMALKGSEITECVICGAQWYGLESQDYGTSDREPDNFNQEKFYELYKSYMIRYFGVDISSIAKDGHG